ncbi:dGTP triphosphohydrolase [Capnocytophaga canis]|nr:dNTP triphosphohydrolase [Capnocytophaga canis]
MDWKRLLSSKRVSEFDSCNVKSKASQFEDPRSPFERDFDQITFSYPFRRLQDKTQVIPFPKLDFVHTRLTHSLEVASVGRSFGKLVANLIKEKQGDEVLGEYTSSDIGALIAAACLAHDIGNPPFGHSGEDSISNYFIEGGKDLEGSLESKRFKDLSHFEGNANGFRIITKNCGKGINPTCALLGTFTKYPRESYLEKVPNYGEEGIPKSQTKYGFFQAEKELFKKVAEELGLIKVDEVGDDDIAYHRHPLAFLMEASDDIAYGMIDFEDGCRLGLIDFDKKYGKIILRNKKNEKEEKEINKSPKEILCDIAKMDESFSCEKMESFEDYKQQLSYLRSKVINVLIHKCFEIFKREYEDIMMGKFDKDLISCIDKEIINNLELIKVLIRKYVYQHPSVLESEASGFEVIEHLIKSFAMTSNICFSCGDKETAKQKKMRSLLPEEFQPTEDGVVKLEGEQIYNRMLSILDYISGMTDKYAVHLYRRIIGIEI